MVGGMNMKDIIEKIYNIDVIEKIKSGLVDNESKDIFDARIQYMLNGDRDTFVESVEPYLSNIVSWELNAALKNRDGIIIYGSGYYGIYDKKVVELCGYKVDYFCDSYEHGHKVDGIEVISPQEVVEKYNNYLVIISSASYGWDMRKNLIQLGFLPEHIIFPKEVFLLGNSTSQYFDFFEPNESEIFLDAGAYDGDTVNAFLKWTKNNYGGIYIIEPLTPMAHKIKERAKAENWNDYKVINAAVWNKNEKMKFTHNGTASRINMRNGIETQCVRIDDIIDNEKIPTFIKMDVEGAEKNAILGAENTISRYKPRLAISIYHKPKDIIEIPTLLKELVPEYKFAIRHYSTNVYETVLYTWI